MSDSHSKRQWYTYWLTLMTPSLLLSYPRLSLFMPLTLSLIAIQQRVFKLLLSRTEQLFPWKLGNRSGQHPQNPLIRMAAVKLTLMKTRTCIHTNRINDKHFCQRLWHLSAGWDDRKRKKGSRDIQLIQSRGTSSARACLRNEPDSHPRGYVTTNRMLWIGIRQDHNDICHRRCGRLAFLTALSVWSKVWGSYSEVYSLFHILQSFPRLPILNSCKQWMIYEDGTAGRAISCSYCTPRPLWIMALSVVRPRVCWALLKGRYWPAWIRLCGQPLSPLTAAAALLIFKVSLLKSPDTPLNPL